MCVCVRVSVNHELVRAIIHQPFKLVSPNLDQRCKSPRLRSLFFVGWLTVIFKVKLNLKVKIYPILGLWVCPGDKSIPNKVRLLKFRPKIHLSTVKVPIDFGIDWTWSSVSFLTSNLLYSTKFCILDICVILYIFSEAIATECSTSHMAPHIYWFLCMRTGSRYRPWNNLPLYLGETIGFQPA